MISMDALPRSPPSLDHCSNRVTLSTLPGDSTRSNEEPTIHRIAASLDPDTFR